MIHGQSMTRGVSGEKSLSVYRGCKLYYIFYNIYYIVISILKITLSLLSYLLNLRLRLFSYCYYFSL